MLDTVRFGVLVLIGSLRERHQDLYVVYGEEARFAVNHAFIPVVIDLIGEDDDVTLFKAQLALVLRLKVVQTSTAGLVHVCLYFCKEQNTVSLKAYRFVGHKMC